MSEEPYETVDNAELVRLAIREVKDASRDIPTERRAAVDDLINRAEEMLAMARSKSAKELGFQLHDCKYPPALLLWNEAMQARICENCGHIRRSAGVALRSNAASRLAARRGGDGTGWMGN